MRWLLFISRVALLCDLCFSVAQLIRYWRDFIHDQDINTYIITMGYASYLLNLLITVLLVVLVIRKKPLPVPSWMAITIIAFLLIQIIKTLFFSL